MILKWQAGNTIKESHPSILIIVIPSIGQVTVKFKIQLLSSFPSLVDDLGLDRNVWYSPSTIEEYSPAGAGSQDPSTIQLVGMSAKVRLAAILSLYRPPFHHNRPCL